MLLTNIMMPFYKRGESHRTRERTEISMPRGIKNGSNIDTALQELFGGIKIQCVFFAAEVGVSANWVAERISTLLCPQREGFQYHLSELREETPGIGRAMEPLALAVHAHRGGTPSTIEAQPKPRKAHSYWDGLTPEERSKEMKRRMKKWRPESKNKWSKKGHPRKPAKGKKQTLDEAQKLEKQKIYAARSLARKEGKPLPPLPPKLGDHQEVAA
jgi:hypothetical protein